MTIQLGKVTSEIKLQFTACTTGKTTTRSFNTTGKNRQCTD